MATVKNVMNQSLERVPVNVVFIDEGHSFKPEMVAYQDEIVRAGYSYQVVADPDDIKSNLSDSIVYRFAGFLRKIRHIGLLEVHSYLSASTRRPYRFRNAVKTLGADVPAGRIFLSPFVQAQFHFPQRRPFIYQDMGAPRQLLDSRGQAEPCADVVYAGSVEGRPGLIECLADLSKKGATIRIAGTASAPTLRRLEVIPGLEFVGRITPTELPEFLRSGRFGLSFQPPGYPLGYQTSTKALEYLVAGLPIIANSCPWISAHSVRHGYSFSEPSSIANFGVFEAPKGSILDPSSAEQFTWPHVLKECDFVGFLLSLQR